MTTERSWPAQLTDISGAQIKRYRQHLDLTTDELARKVTAAGLKCSRDQVVNIEREKGRRTAITVGEVIVFAAVLGIPPAFLVMPVGSEEPIEYLPGRTMDAWHAYEWFTGDGSDSLVRDGFELHDSDVRTRLHAYRDHDKAVLYYDAALRDLKNKTEDDDENQLRERVADKLEVLIARRDSLRARRWALPWLPQAMSQLVEQAEKRNLS